MSIFMYIKLAEYYNIKLSEIIFVSEEKYELNKNSSMDIENVMK